MAGGQTDFDGKYNINPVAPGSYDVVASFVGYATVTQSGVTISPNAPTLLDFKLREKTEELDEVVIIYEAPLIDKTKSSKVTTSEDIVNMAVRDITSVASQAAGVTQDANGNTNIRGARDEGTVYFIDGVKVRGSVSIPQAAIAQTEVITGGLPAQYGDAVGGVISTTTKGPSSDFFGSAEVVSSSLFDPYHYNLGAFTIGGPINKKNWQDKYGNPLLGFLFSSEFQYRKETRPAAIPYVKLNDEKLKFIQENPIVADSASGGYLYSAELVTEDDLEDIQYRPNSYDRDLRLNGSVQLKTSQTTNVSLGGRWNYSNGKSPDYFSHIFNYDNNLDQISSDWSAYMRFQQQFRNDTANGKKSLIKNAFYTIQLDYSQTNSKIYDSRHGDNFFNYGYVGKFEKHEAPRYVYDTDSASGVTGWLFINNDDTAVSFTPGTENPVLSNYMSRYYDFAAQNPSIYTGTKSWNALQTQATPPINGQNPLSVYQGIWTNAGTVQSLSYLGLIGRANYVENRTSQFRVTASTSFDMKDHSIILGFEYEQRSDRAYALDATGLWSQARLLQNAPNQERDLDNPILVYDDQGVFQDTVLYNRKYSENDASRFAEQVRVALGMDPKSTEVINIDNLDPDVLDVSMFAPDELINPGATRYVGYYGYDYLGNMVNDNISTADFFLERDASGNLTRPVAPFQPIYIAGYIQDQFTFKDLTFNVGVRVDRFDLNQDVLRDPYIVYPFYTVADLANSPLANKFTGENALQIPGNIGGDYRVYVNDYDYSDDGTTIVGYRNGDDFYDANGELLTDPSVLSDAAGGGIKPFTVQTPEERADAEAAAGGKFIPAGSFTDYDPQVVVMPRIAFNFPITDEAIFIAHYDLLAQRPTTGISRLDPFDYLDLINNRSTGALNNPNLKPQKTTEYELGFKQVLTEDMAIKISAFYRELRDLLQTVAFTQAYPITYVAYGNRDFGTVKGFSFEYEMRRVNNFKIDANYTLQFADGTGSSATSGLNLARSGQPNLRYILPLTYDNRHQLMARIDYRYGRGPRYNGPVWWDKKVLESFGVNLTMNAISGSPYTKRDAPYIVTNTNPSSVSLVEGQINGSRLPWQVTFDMRVNKVFSLKDKKSFEVYVQVLNLFDKFNVTGVYPYTGSPDDDGYLASPEAQANLSDQTSSQAFVDLYNRRVMSPFNYGLPRRIRLGLVYNF